MFFKPKVIRILDLQKMEITDTEGNSRKLTEEERRRIIYENQL